MKTPANTAFKPHFNRATGRYYYTKDDFYKDLKARGLEPYDPSMVKDQRKEYIPSAWAREMVNVIKNAQKDSKGRPILGGRFYDELERNGVDLRRGPRDNRTTGLNPTQGGFSA